MLAQTALLSSSASVSASYAKGKLCLGLVGSVHHIYLCIDVSHMRLTAYAYPAGSTCMQPELSRRGTARCLDGWRVC